MAWTQEDSAKMDAAAATAESRLKALLAEHESDPEMITGMILLLNWWHNNFMQAGHKRLYKIADRVLPTSAHFPSSDEE